MGLGGKRYLVKIAIIQSVRAKSGCTALDLATLVDSNQVNMVLIVEHFFKIYLSSGVSDVAASGYPHDW